MKKTSKQILGLLFRLGPHNLFVLTGFLHVYEEMEKAQAAMVRLMIKVREAAGPSGSQGSYCPRLVGTRRTSCHFVVGQLCQKSDGLSDSATNVTK